MLEKNFEMSRFELNKMRRILEEQRVIIGYNTNKFGEAIITTGVPVQTQPDNVCYTKVKKMFDDNYIIHKIAKSKRR